MPSAKPRSGSPGGSEHRPPEACGGHHVHAVHALPRARERHGSCERRSAGYAQLVDPPCHRGGQACRPHIPQGGALLSPHVEVFRTGSDSGYEFEEEVATLEAVVSVATPNANRRVRDSPIDRTTLHAIKLLQVRFCYERLALSQTAAVILVEWAGKGRCSKKPSPARLSEDNEWLVRVALVRAIEQASEECRRQSSSCRPDSAMTV